MSPCVTPVPQNAMKYYIHINSLRPRRNRRHFTDIFKCIIWNENVSSLIKISLKFIPKGPINSIPALLQIMAWHRQGDKPLSEPMMIIILTHICVTRPQWVNINPGNKRLIIVIFFMPSENPLRPDDRFVSWSSRNKIHGNLDSNFPYCYASMCLA